MLIQCIEQLIQYFNGQRRKFDLPINQQGTSFQQEVWNELMAISSSWCPDLSDESRRRCQRKK